MKSVVTVAGCSGLFRTLKTTRQGLLLESLDERKSRTVKHLHTHKLSSLADISIFSTEAEKTMPIAKVLANIYLAFADKLDAGLYDSPEKLHALMQRMAPGYDQERVSVSSIKKLINWYNILVQYAPNSLASITVDRRQEA